MLTKIKQHLETYDFEVLVLACVMLIASLIFTVITGTTQGKNITGLAFLISGMLVVFGVIYTLGSLSDRNEKLAVVIAISLLSVLFGAPMAFIIHGAKYNQKDIEIVSNISELYHADLADLKGWNTVYPDVLDKELAIIEDNMKIVRSNIDCSFFACGSSIKPHEDIIEPALLKINSALSILEDQIQDGHNRTLEIINQEHGDLVNLVDLQTNNAIRKYNSTDDYIADFQYHNISYVLFCLSWIVLFSLLVFYLKDEVEEFIVKTWNQFNEAK